MGNCLNALLPALAAASASVASDEENSCTQTLIPSPCFSEGFTPPSPRRDIHSLYTLGRSLGNGQFGYVRLCTSRSTGAEFACKSIPKFRDQSSDAIAREVRIHRLLSDSDRDIVGANIDPGRVSPIPLLRDVFEDSSSVHLVMDLCPGGDLFDRIKKRRFFPEHLAATVLRSLIQTVQFCHSLGVMHRDLKPENILFLGPDDDSPIQLIDFGLAAEFLPGQKFSETVGSAYYVAPEVIQGEYSEQIDVWSAGVILYVLLCGRPPFWGPTERAILNAIQKAKVRFNGEPWSNVSSSAKDLVLRMLTLDPKERLTPAQVLEHPWMVHHATHIEECEGHVAVNTEACTTTTEPASGALDSSENQPLPTSEAADYSAQPLPSSEAADDCAQLVPSSEAADDCAQPVPSSEAADNSAQAVPTSEDSAMKIQLLPLATTNEVSNSNLNLNKILTALVDALNDAPVSKFQSIPRMRLQDGWSCNVLTSTATEQTLLVDSGKKKYIVVHDRQRNRIGWKILEQKYFQRRYPRSADVRLHNQCQPVF